MKITPNRLRESKPNLKNNLSTNSEFSKEALLLILFFIYSFFFNIYRSKLLKVSYK